MSRLTRAAPPPRTLGSEAAKLWRSLLPMCVRIGSVRTSDLAAFELLVVALATERQARARLDQDGLTVVTAAGGLKSHPCLRTAECARAQALGLLGQFGLTPVALQGSATWEGDA